MTPEERKQIEEVISQWSEDMQTAAQIRALECGFPTAADHLHHMILSDLANPQGLNAFLKEHPEKPSEEKFVRDYFGS